MPQELIDEKVKNVSQPGKDYIMTLNISHLLLLTNANVHNCFSLKDPLLVVQTCLSLPSKKHLGVLVK